MTFQISGELLSIMVEKLIEAQDKRTFDVPSTMTATQVQELTTETISLTVSLVVSGEIVYK